MLTTKEATVLRETELPGSFFTHPQNHHLNEWFTRNETLLGCGDLTQRILSALIEEKLLPKSAAETNFDEEPTEEADRVPEDPYDAPVYNYNENYVLSLEDRIKSELKAIGLIDEADVCDDDSGCWWWECYGEGSGEVVCDANHHPRSIPANARTTKFQRKSVFSRNNSASR